LISTNNKILPYAALGFGVLALSMSSIFIRWAQAPGPITSFYRMATAALILSPVIFLHNRARGYKLPLRWLIFPVAGGLFTALDHGAWSTAVNTTRVANATLLNNMAPLWVALFVALIWGERLRARFWLGLAITLAGAAVVMSGDMIFSPEQNGGNLLALFSSLFYAGYFLITQRGRSHVDALTYVWLVDIFAALSLLGISQALRMPLTGYSTVTWLVFLAAALVSQIGGYFSIAYALGHLPASVVSPTLVIQPVLTAVAALMIFGETLAPMQWMGGLATVAGIYLVNISHTEAVKLNDPG
jgi:drug/metabolite transporter (DMT)-like permease